VAGRVCCHAAVILRSAPLLSGALRAIGLYLRPAPHAATGTEAGPTAGRRGPDERSGL